MNVVWKPNAKNISEGDMQNRGHYEYRDVNWRLKFQGCDDSALQCVNSSFGPWTLNLGPGLSLAQAGSQANTFFCHHFT
jgi:hypothetical protein